MAARKTLRVLELRKWAQRVAVAVRYLPGRNSKEVDDRLFCLWLQDGEQCAVASASELAREDESVAGQGPKAVAAHPCAAQLERAASTKLVDRALRENAGCVPHLCPLVGAQRADLAAEQMSILPSVPIFLHYPSCSRAI